MKRLPRHAQRALQFFAAAVLAAIVIPSPASAQVRWRVSIKIVNDAFGNRPPSWTDVAIDSQVDIARATLAANGDRFDLNVTETVDLLDAVPAFLACDPGAVELLAGLDPTSYLLRSNAINVYLTNGACPGACSFPGSGNVIVLGNAANAESLLHEIGHFMGLCHTQGCFCDGCTVPGDDGICDTLEDVAAWGRDEIAMNAYGLSYAELSATQQDRVNDVWWNVMSYHNTGTRSRFTEQQLDEMATTSNGSRSNVASARVIFVDSTSPVGTGSVLFPFGRVQDAVDAAADGDVIVLRPGDYPDALAPVTKQLLLVLGDGGFCNPSSGTAVLR